MKSKYGAKAKSYVDTNPIIYMKTEDIYVGIAKDVETRFDTSNHELERPLPKGKIKKLSHK